MRPSLPTDAVRAPRGVGMLATDVHPFATHASRLREKPALHWNPHFVPSHAVVAFAGGTHPVHVTTPGVVPPPAEESCPAPGALLPPFASPLVEWPTPTAPGMPRLSSEAVSDEQPAITIRTPTSVALVGNVLRLPDDEQSNKRSTPGANGGVTCDGRWLLSTFDAHVVRLVWLRRPKFANACARPCRFRPWSSAFHPTLRRPLAIAEAASVRGAALR